MGVDGRARSVPDYEAIIEALKECLEDTLSAINLGREEGIRPHILALEALDELDGFLNGLKRDLGV